MFLINKNVSTFLETKHSEQEIIAFSKANGLKKCREFWICIFAEQDLSGVFLKKMVLPKIFKSQTTENSIWYRICCWHKLSENFIRNNQSNINWSALSLNISVQLSDRFCEEFDEKLIRKLGYSTFVRINGKYHRTLGPALTHSFNNKLIEEYWYRGQRAENVHSMKEYRHWLKLRLFV